MIRFNSYLFTHIIKTVGFVNVLAGKPKALLNIAEYDSKMLFTELKIKMS